MIRYLISQVEGTNTENNVHLFDNVNDYRVKKQSVGKRSNGRQIKKINLHYKGKLHSVC